MDSSANELIKAVFDFYGVNEGVDTYFYSQNKNYQQLKNVVGSDGNSDFTGAWHNAFVISNSLKDVNPTLSSAWASAENFVTEIYKHADKELQELCEAIQSFATNTFSGEEKVNEAANIANAKAEELISSLDALN